MTLRPCPTQLCLLVHGPRGTWAKSLWSLNTRTAASPGQPTLCFYLCSSWEPHAQAARTTPNVPWGLPPTCPPMPPPDSLTNRLLNSLYLRLRVCLQTMYWGGIGGTNLCIHKYILIPYNLMRMFFRKTKLFTVFVNVSRPEGTTASIPII